MTPERFRRIEHVFDAAADAAPGERDAVLERQCGDDTALRAEVEALLAASAGADERIHRALRREAELTIGGGRSAAAPSIAAPRTPPPDRRGPARRRSIRRTQR